MQTTQDELRELPEWQNHPVYTRDDGSYVITFQGYPYHAPNEGEFADLWAEIDAWAREHPDQLQAEPGPPLPTLEEAGDAKRAEIRSAFDAALVATLTMPTAHPTTTEITAEAVLFASMDPDGLEEVKRILTKRRDELLEQVDLAGSVDEVRAINVTYPV